MTKKCEKEWDKSKLESYKAEAEKHLGEPVLLTEYNMDQIEVATEAGAQCASPSAATKSCC